MSEFSNAIRTPSFFRFKTTDPIIIQQGYSEALRLYQMAVENPSDNTYKDEWNLKYSPDFDVFDNWNVTKDLPTNQFSECYLLIFVHGSIITTPDLNIIEVPAPRGKKIIKKNISSPGCVTTMKGAKQPTYNKTDVKRFPDKYIHIPTYISKMTNDFLENLDTCYTRSEWIESANKISRDDAEPITKFLELNPENDRSCLLQESQPTYALKHYSVDPSGYDNVSIFVKNYNEDGSYRDFKEYDLLEYETVTELLENCYDASITGISLDRFMLESYNGYTTGVKASTLGYTFDTYQLFNILSILRFNTIHILDHSCNTYRKLTGEPPKTKFRVPPTIPLGPGEIPQGIGYTGYGKQRRRPRRHSRNNIKRKSKKNRNNKHNKTKRRLNNIK
jgi:hypothetical protein